MWDEYICKTIVQLFFVLCGKQVPKKLRFKYLFFPHICKWNHLQFTSGTCYLMKSNCGSSCKVQNASVIKIKFFLINFIHSDLVSLEFLYVADVYLALSRVVCTWFCFNATLLFFSKNSRKYFYPPSSCASQHGRTKLVPQLDVASCSVACEVPRVTDPWSVLRHQHMVRKKQTNWRQHFPDHAALFLNKKRAELPSGCSRKTETCFVYLSC